MGARRFAGLPAALRRRPIFEEFGGTGLECVATHFDLAVAGEPDDGLVDAFAHQRVEHAYAADAADTGHVRDRNSCQAADRSASSTRRRNYLLLKSRIKHEPAHHRRANSFAILVRGID